MGIPFVGRESELGDLRALVDEARAGTLRTALIVGEAGIGKSTLGERAIEHARETGFDVGIGRCGPPGRLFGPVIDALMSTDRSDRARDLTAGDPERFHTPERLIATLESLALERPLALLLDDIHLAEDETLALVRAAANRLAYAPLVLITTSRPQPPAMADVSLTIDVQPLDARAVEQMAEEMLGARADDRLLALIARASGNPLFIGELLTALQQHGALAIDDDVATTSTTEMPRALSLTVLQRLGTLADETRGLLDMAAVLGPEFDPRDLAVAMHRSVGSLHGAIVDAIRQRILVERDAKIAFRHSLVHDAIYAAIPEGVRRGLHHEFARALEVAGAPVAQVAEHYARGARSGDDDAVRAIVSAARTKGMTPRSRIGLLERALDLMSDADARRDDVLAELAEAMAAGGRPGDAEPIALAVLGNRPAHAIARRMRSVVLEAREVAGRYPELLEVAEQWLAGDPIDEHERVAMMSFAAGARVMSKPDEIEQAERVARVAVALAEDLDDPLALVRSLAGLAACVSATDPKEALTLVERAITLAPALPEEGARFRLHLQRGTLLQRSASGADDLTLAEEAHREGLRLAESYGRVSDVPHYLSALATVRYMRDDWDGALAEAEAALAAAAEVGSLDASALSILAHVTIVRGDIERGERYVRMEEERESARGYDEVALLHRSMLDEMRGDLRGAFEGRWRWFVGRDPRAGATRWWRCLWFALTQGEDEKAATVAGVVPEPEQALARALCDRDARGVVTALHTMARDDVAFHEQAAMSLAFVGRTDEAIPHLRSVETYFDAVGAQAWFDQLVRQLMPFGVAYRRKKRKAAPAQGWEALTPTEQRVARFAAEGLTNRAIGERMFVSPRTVQTHLAHVFEKMGLRSRVELTRALARRST